MMTKTIAQMAILSWVELHFGIRNMDIEFTGTREAFITDKNGGTLSN